MKYKSTFILLCLVSLLSACSGSGIKPYSSDLKHNIQVKTKTSTASYFSSIKARLDIYQVDKGCKVIYQGSVKLDKPVVNTGIPQARNNYLVFNFASSSFLGGSSSISYDTLLKTRKGYSYDIEVSYADNIYNVELFERGKKKSARRAIEIKELDNCR
ncbi:MAG: hypothetical protein OEY43_08920 [Gammaproteobacteria bacterium]|nr:hypothetical protein [Gammaproteobacteria bacterium]